MGKLIVALAVYMNVTVTSLTALAKKGKMEKIFALKR